MLKIEHQKETSYMAKDRRTKAELQETLRRLDSACEAREKELEANVKCLQDENAHLKGLLDKTQISIGTFDAENRKLRKQLETIEAEHQKKAEIVRAHTKGRLKGQREAFLDVIELMLQSV